MPISILCATDNNFAPYCGIMLTSLFENNLDSRFEVYVLANGDILESHKRKFNDLGQKYGSRITWMTVDESKVEAFPTHIRRITRPTYYRLFAAELLPQDLDRVIYLDCDLLVVGDIKPLWEIDLTGNALACVTDSLEKGIERLGYPKSEGYFNAGVLVLNLQYWRENGVGAKLTSHAMNHRADLKMMDQDILNGVLHAQKVLLPPRFNFQTFFFATDRRLNYSDAFRISLSQESDSVVIVHYVGNEKPWNFRLYGGPFFSLWEKFRRRSFWRNDCVRKPYFKYIKHVLKRRCFLGLFARQHPQWSFSPEIRRYYR